jgi:TPR repeat protein
MSGRAAAGAPPPPPPPPPSTPAPYELPDPPRHHADPKRCLFCGVVLTGKWKRCGGCRSEYFCSRDHFEAAWPAHAAACLVVQEREEAERRAGGLVLSADTERERREARAAAEAAAEEAEEDALERARVEGLDERALRRELLRREIALPAEAPREALLAARLAAPDPTPEQNLNFVRREVAAHEWAHCRFCERALPDALGTTGRCSGCRRLRYCGAECQREHWPRHRAECRAWKAEADAAIVAAGGCPLGDIAAQRAAIDKVKMKPLAAVRAAAEGGDLAAQYVLGASFYFGAGGFPKDAAQALLWLRRAAAGNLAHAHTDLGVMHDRGEGGLAVDHEEAFRLYSLAARQGDAEAQFNCGCCLRDGEGVARDLSAAASFFRQAAEQGDAKAQATLARALMLGDGVARDYAEALKWARRAVEQRSRLGEQILGELYHNGWGVPANPREAATYHARAAAQGAEGSKNALCLLATEGVSEATAALHRLGLDAPLRAADAAVVAAGRCPLGDVAAQEAAIKTWLARPLAAIRAAAEGGDLAAMEALGECFYNGVKGAPKDAVQAVVWYQRAASANMARAQCDLGVLHKRGEGGLEKNDAKAMALYRLAAAAGFAPALYNLGNGFRDGLGVPQDLAEAARLWRQAADKGFAKAEAELARAYMLGLGVEKDYDAALRLARRAADKGDAFGEYFMGLLCAEGLGVPQIDREAARWWAKSAAQGDEDAITGLRTLAAAGVPEAVAALRRLRLAP